ncbi:hypothetical protein Ddc_02940 [Ditylenchus destructor]|nr:hypothetical protein Ddc_02940 [Ditylenchus destructor]
MNADTSRRYDSMQRDGNSLFSPPPFEHHQSKPERMIVRLLYNVFIAPFYTTLAACAIFTVYLSATFFVAYLGFKFINGLTSKYTHLLTDSDGADIYCAIASSALLTALFSTYLSTSKDRLLLGLFTACSVTASGLLAQSLHFSRIELSIGIGAVFGVAVYLFYLEPGQHTVSNVVICSYSKFTAAEKWRICGQEKTQSVT